MQQINQEERVMKKTLLATLLAGLFVSVSAFADGAYNYASPSIDFKDKVNSTTTIQFMVLH